MTVMNLGHSLRSMSCEEKTVTLAVSVVLDRIVRLSPEDREDLFSLAKELPVAPSEEDVRGICETMVEILEGRKGTLESVELEEAASQPEGWKKYVDWISKRIRDARSEAGLTQEQLAQRMDTTQSVIARLEGGRTRPSTQTLEKLAAATGTTLKISF